MKSRTKFWMQKKGERGEKARKMRENSYVKVVWLMGNKPYMAAVRFLSVSLDSWSQEKTAGKVS